MAQSTLTLIRNNRTAQLAVGVLGTLLLGALGSGLWEFLLRDVFISLGNVTLTFISSIWGGYVDLLHRDIGKLRQDSLTVPMFAIAMVLLMFGPWAMIARLLEKTSRLRKRLLDEENDDEEITAEQLAETLIAIRRKVLWRLAPLVAVMTVFYAVIAWQIAYTRNAANWAERSIEILRPYVTQQEYVSFRSDLRSIEDADSFYRLEKRVQTTAGKLSVKLPAFTVIGRQV